MLEADARQTEAAIKIQKPTKTKKRTKAFFEDDYTNFFQKT